MSADDATLALSILAQVDRALQGTACDVSTDCCRFALTGREPWLTAVEWRLLLAELRRQGRRLPALNDEPDGRCPFLAADARCVVYPARPLGCRTFFCHRSRGAAPPRQRSFREAARQLAMLSEGQVAAGDDGKARPLRSWLAAGPLAPGNRRRRKR